MKDNQRKNGEGKGKGAMKSWVFIVLTVIIVAGIGATAFGMLKDKDPMTRYLTAEQNTLEKQMTFLESQSEQMEQLEEKMMEKAFRSNSTITADFNLEDGAQSLGAMLPMIKGMVSSSKIETEQRMDPGTKETFLAFDLLLQGQSLGNAEFYQNETDAALKVPFLYESYFTLPNDQFGEFLRKYGEEAAGMEVLPNLADYQSATLTRDEMDEIAKDYVTALIKELDKEQFKMENGIAYEDGKFDKITLTLSEDETKEILKVMLDKLKNDDRIWDIVEAQMNMNMAAGNVEDGKASVEELKKEVENLKLPDGFKLEAYIDGDVVVYRDVNFTVGHAEAAETAAVAIHTSYSEENDDTYTSTMEMNFVPATEEDTVTFTLKEKGNKSGEELQFDHTISLTMKEAGGPSTIGADLSSVIKDNTTEMTFDVRMEGAMFAGGPVPELGGYFNTETEVDGSAANQKMDLGIDFAMQDPMMGPVSGRVEFHIDTDTAFTDDLQFPSLDDSETVNVMETSPQEMEEIMREVQMNLQSYYQNMFGSFGGLGAF
ncbi:DUF6583 family protein [Thalassobacillus devorans]|uniref:DUF6583 family protein n=1 Tax=Thalassobacillus devorans TaxID=279813 RepID=UPI00048AF69C|nr:DUF6583 family protein [Thalassobacillus devorans]